MWSRFARVGALAMVAMLASCGARRLELVVSLDDARCGTRVPAGGSLLYEVSVGDIDAPDGGPRQFCGGCLPVAATLDGSEAIVAFLRANAPACAGVRPEATVLVRVTAWAEAACPSAKTPLLCAASMAITVPDGRSDAQVAMPLACPVMCGTTCVPTSCADRGLDCGFVSDGCGVLLSCGMCRPPQKCGGAGVANVCGK